MKLNWQNVKFGDVVRLNTDRIADPAAAGIERYVGLEHIEPEDLQIRRWGLVAEGTTFTNYFKPGQTLFGKRRAYQRKVAVADFAGVCSGDIYVFEPKDNCLLLELLPFICQTERFYEYAVGTSAGSLSPRTNWTQLAQYEFALPPLAEQRRMAEVLWAVENQLISYDQLTLNAQRLILSVAATITKMRYLDERNLSQLSLPPDWKLKHIGQLCELGGGYGFRPKDWSDKGLPIIRIQNLNGSQEFNYFAGEPLEEWIVEPGELLFAWAGMPGVSFGPCLWPGPIGVLNQHIYRVTPVNGVSKTWLYHVLRLLTPWIERRAHGFKTSLLHIRQKELTDRLIPVPPSKTQDEIAETLQRYERAIEEISQRLSKVRTLKERLLAKKLSGATET
jgi:type I restriction enzyme, S subunit